MIFKWLLIVIIFYTSNLSAIAIAITKLRDLTFTNATKLAPAEILSPISSASSQFRVTGDPNRSFLITFPSGNRNMTNGSTNIGADIWTSDTTTPATLDATGTKIISIGGTRAFVPSNSAPGTYTGTHTVRVRYSALTTQKSATASHSVSIMQSILLSVAQSLSFSDAFRGDSASTVSISDSGRAILNVTGQASTPYSITLPANNAIKMSRIGGSGGTTDSIIISSFASNPSGTGTLSTLGTQSISVGATRAAILSNQVIGDYTGTFTVRVTYQ